MATATQTRPGQSSTRPPEQSPQVTRPPQGRVLSRGDGKKSKAASGKKEEKTHGFTSASWRAANDLAENVLIKYHARASNGAFGAAFIVWLVPGLPFAIAPIVMVGVGIRVFGTGVRGLRTVDGMVKPIGDTFMKYYGKPVKPAVSSSVDYGGNRNAGRRAPDRGDDADDRGGRPANRDADRGRRPEGRDDDRGRRRRRPDRDNPDRDLDDRDDPDLDDLDRDTDRDDPDRDLDDRDDPDRDLDDRDDPDLDDLDRDTDRDDPDRDLDDRDDPDLDDLDRDDDDRDLDDDDLDRDDDDRDLDDDDLDRDTDRDDPDRNDPDRNDSDRNEADRDSDESRPDPDAEARDRLAGLRQARLEAARQHHVDHPGEIAAWAHEMAADLRAMQRRLRAHVRDTQVTVEAAEAPRILDDVHYGTSGDRLSSQEHHDSVINRIAPGGTQAEVGRALREFTGVNYSVLLQSNRPGAPIRDESQAMVAVLLDTIDELAPHLDAGGSDGPLNLKDIDSSHPRYRQIVSALARIGATTEALADRSNLDTPFNANPEQAFSAEMARDIRAAMVPVQFNIDALTHQAEGPAFGRTI